MLPWPQQKNKTVETVASVDDFLNGIEDARRRTDAFALVSLMENVTGYKATMWGLAIIGFGSYHYRYESGREGDAPLVGFSPRKAEFALYLSSSFDGRDELLQQLGKHKTAKACVYVKKLSDVNTKVLEEMVKRSVKSVKEKYA